MWNGLFSPVTRKEIGTVGFLPLEKMTDEDWEFLDYDNLRETALNRIAPLIVKGELVGFFDVNILEKAAAKNRYLWPARQADVRDFKEGDHSFFRNKANVDEVVEEVDMLKMASPSIMLREPRLWVKALRAILIASRAEDEPQSENIEQAQELLLKLEDGENKPYLDLRIKIIIGKIARELNKSFEEALELVVERMSEDERKELDTALDDVLD